MYKIEINSGEEIIETLTNFLKKHGITEGAIVSVIGATGSCKVTSMHKNDAKKIIEKEYHEPLEITGTGEIENGIPHIHAVFGREDQSAIHGHLEWGNVTDWFVHVYLLPLETKSA